MKTKENKHILIITQKEIKIVLEKECQINSFREIREDIIIPKTMNSIPWKRNDEKTWKRFWKFKIQSTKYKNHYQV